MAVTLALGAIVIAAAMLFTAAVLYLKEHGSQEPSERPEAVRGSQ